MNWTDNYFLPCWHDTADTHITLLFFLIFHLSKKSGFWKMFAIKYGMASYSSFFPILFVKKTVSSNCREHLEQIHGFFPYLKAVWWNWCRELLVNCPCVFLDHHIPPVTCLFCTTLYGRQLLGHGLLFPLFYFCWEIACTLLIDLRNILKFITLFCVLREKIELNNYKACCFAFVTKSSEESDRGKSV